MWKFPYIEVFKRWVSFVGPSVPQNPHDVCSAISEAWTPSLPLLHSHTLTVKREGDAIKLILNSLTFSTFPSHFTPVSCLCAGTLGFLLDGVFLIRSLLLSSAKGSLLNIFFKLHIASVGTKHNNNNNNNINDYKILTGCGGKKRGEEFNGWPMINSENYALAQICFRSNTLTIIIFSTSATFVERNGKLFWIPL